MRQPRLRTVLIAAALMSLPCGCIDLVDEDAAIVVLTAGGNVVGVADGGGGTVWSTSLGSGSHGDLLVDGGTIFVIRGSSEVVALDSVDGTEIWSVDAGGTTVGELAFLGDTLFTQTLDRVVALDAGSGNELWNEPFSGLSGAMAAGAGAVFCGGDPVRRLDPGDGGELASAPTGHSQVAAVALTGGHVLVGGWDVVLSLMPETLAVSWDYPLVNASASGVTVDGGDAWVATDNDGLLGFAASDGNPFMTALEGLPLDRPVADGGTVYVTESYGDLHAIDAASGDELWSSSTSNDRSGGIRVDGGTLYLGDGDSLVGISASDGIPEWEFASGTTILDIELL